MSRDSALPPGSEMSSWGRPSRQVRLARDERLFRRGDPVEWFFLMERGRVRLERTLEDGTAVTLATVHGKGEVAVSSLFASEYHCDAVAEISSWIVAISRDEALAAIRTEPTRAEALVRRLSTEVRRLRALIELRSIHPASDRVRQYLQLGEMLADPSQNRPLKTIAAEIGLAPETLYRALSALEEEGRIERKGRRIQLIT